MFFVSQYNLYEVAVAALAVVTRIREKFASDPRSGSTRPT